MPDIDNVPAEIAVQLRNERDTMQRAHVEESKRAETAERQAAFWKDRYDTQHRTVHGLEGTVEQLREALRVVRALPDDAPRGAILSAKEVARHALEKAQGPP